MSSIRVVPVPPGPGALTLLPALTSALRGGTDLLVPYPLGGPEPEVEAGYADRSPDSPVLAVGTSGSTGPAKRALLSAAALRASAAATEARLGGPGRWLLALPAAHIAGLQVLIRSIIAGTVPTVLDAGPGTGRSFTPEAFAAATAELLGGGAPGTNAPDRGRARPRGGDLPAYTSLVPTQLALLLDDATGIAALRGYAAVLVGGAATPSTLLERARELGVRCVTTYGMSETAGGCVYDGTPLDGVRIALDDNGRIALGGPTVALGYLPRPGSGPHDEAFTTGPDGTRWFRTDDLGHLEEGRLVVDARADDVIVTGGYKVRPRVVEEALAPLLPPGASLCAVGVPDEVWGQAIVLVIAGPGAPTPGDDGEALRAGAGEVLPRYAVPRRVVVLDRLPLTGVGKPDRAQILRIVAGQR